MFRRPPPTYYTLPNKSHEILGVHGDPETFRELGILIDQEDDNTERCDDNAVDTEKIQSQKKTNGLYYTNGDSNDVSSDDTENDVYINSMSTGRNSGYILQIFTHPLFW